MNKRKFLKAVTAMGLTSQCPNLFATQMSQNIPKNNKEPRLFYIFLRGGFDGLSFVVPHAEKKYYESRPLIALPKEKTLNISADFSINPSLKESFYNLYKNNQAIFIPSSGQNHNSRSHFLSQDIMLYGANKAINSSGYLNRLAEVTGLNGTSFTESIKPIFKGEVHIPTFSLNDLEYEISIEQEKIIQENLSKDPKLSREFNNILMNKNIFMNINKKEDKNYNRVSQFKRIARYMDKSDSNFGFYEYGNWDSHNMQNPFAGPFVEMVKMLNNCIDAFKMNTLPENWDRTTIILISEFGRTIQENGGSGTDHGHGNLLALLGGQIKKSKVLGEWDGLNKLHENRDLFVRHDYRDVFSKLFEELYGLNSNQLAYIFPNAKKEQMNILI